MAEINDNELLEELLSEHTEEQTAVLTEETDASADEEADAEPLDASEEEVPLKAAPKRKKKKKGYGRLVFGIVLTTVIIVAAFLLAYFIIRFGKEIIGLDKSTQQIVVTIPENSGTEDIANILYDQGIINETWLFRAISRLRGADGLYIAGEHILSPSMGYDEMIETLQENIAVLREEAEVTFIEGITLADAAKLLEEAEICSAEEFIKTFNSASYGFDFEEKVNSGGLKFYKMEGYLFPDTYRFYKEEDPKIVAKKIYANFENKVTPDYYGRMKDLGMPLDETLTLASIIQSEANTPYEMRRVSSVFRNRLRNADSYPLLQSDPTSNYVKKVIKKYIEVPNQDMYTAYDTYEGAGLPPGPICNPGLDAIYAALYPEDTDYYFFCANVETREFFYAKTNAEHEENLKLAGLK